MTDIAKSVDPNKLYEELGQNYRYFLGWRERIFAGYVTILAGLGLGFAQSGRASFEIGVLVAAVLVSVVFLILDQRTRDLFCQCQLAAGELEKNAHITGVYTALEGLRRPIGSVGTHSFAVKLLVGGIVGGAVAGLLAKIPGWFTLQKHAIPIISGLVVWILLTAALEKWYGIAAKWPLNKAGAQIGRAHV